MILENIDKKYFSKALEKIIIDWYNNTGSDERYFEEVREKIKTLISVLFPPSSLDKDLYTQSLENLNIAITDGTTPEDDNVTLMFTEPGVDTVLYFQVNFYHRGKFIKNPG